MKYINKKIKKTYIELKNVEMTFDINGVYLLQGDNGCGKTTLIENMIFDSNESHFEFENKLEEKTYKKDKHNLFTYVSQKSIFCDTYVLDFIKKMNSQVEYDDIIFYLDKFLLPVSILKCKYCDLSGGEKKKIDIISALLKQTPYYFFDEPTNYLDENSVNNFKEILDIEAQSKKIIIVTHDPRLDLKVVRRYSISDSIVEEKEESIKKEKCQANQCEIPHNKKISFIKFFLGMIKNWPFVASCISMLIILLNLLVYSSMSLENSIGDEYGNYHDSILIYYTGGGHDELNEMYEKANKIKIDPDNYDNYICYDNFGDLVNKAHIDSIYVPDQEYLNDLARDIEENKTNVSSIYSCPNMYIEQYMDTFGDMFCLRFTEGNIPRDEKKEVAISKTVLMKYFGYNENNVNNAIGNTILINGTSYKIVGYSFYDIIIVSYDSKNSQYGYYRYDNNTYSEFYRSQMQYIQKIDGDFAINNILICIDEKYETELLNSLIEKYPSNCFISKSFESSFYIQQKKEVFCKWLFINIIFAMVYATIIALLVKKTMKYNLNIIYDVGNYYINRKEIFRKYVLLQSLLFLLICGLICSMSYIFLKYYYLSNYYIIVDSFIIIVPNFIINLQGYKEVEKR